MNDRERNENRIGELEAEIEWRQKEIEKLKQPQWYDGASTGGGCTADMLILDWLRDIEVLATEAHGGRSPDPSENVTIGITFEGEPSVVFEIPYEGYQMLRKTIFLVN